MKLSASLRLLADAVEGLDLYENQRIGQFVNNMTHRHYIRKDPNILGIDETLIFYIKNQEIFREARKISNGNRKKNRTNNSKSKSK